MSFDVAVEVVERLGSEILLDVAAGSTTMVASVEPTVTAKRTRDVAPRDQSRSCAFFRQQRPEVTFSALLARRDRLGGHGVAPTSRRQPWPK